ncbi:hypothetical protein ACB098_08G068100 [Castanea mollissima]
MPQRDVVNNSMVFGLCWCHLTLDAMTLFYNMSQRDVGSWNSLISGLSQNSEGRNELFLFKKRRVEGAEVDVMTMSNVLSVCADLAALVNGKQVYGLVIIYRFELYLPVGNAIIDMYAKCGRMDIACQFFMNMPIKNVVSWTSLIVGHGKRGLGWEVLEAFDEMERKGIVPNKITFLGTLYACSHAVVQKGWVNFDTMVHKYSITPMMEHYTCMVDLLARAGHLAEAYNFVERMQIKLEAKLITAIFSSCCSHMNVELAKTVGQRLIELEPEEAGAYKLLSNFYRIIGDLEDVANVRKLM